MSTDENITTTSAEGTTAPAQGEPAPQGTETPAEQQRTEAPAPDAAATAASGEDAWEEEPGDDIGNRAPGAPREAAPRAEGETPAKKRRRRRKKKAGAAPGAEAGANAAAEAGEHEHEPEGEEAEAGEGATAEEGGAKPGEPGKAKKKRKKGKGPRPDTQRPAFGVGEEVFGRVCKVTEDAIWIDIAGKAIGLFDMREFTAGPLPPEPTPAEAKPEGEAQATAEAQPAAEAQPSAEAAAPSETAAPSAAAEATPAAEEPSAPADTSTEAEGAPAEASAEAASEEAAAEAPAEPAPPPEPRPEMKTYAEGELPQEGDQFIATVGSVGVRGGMLVLARGPFDIGASKQRLEAAAQSGETVDGFVTGAVKGGLEVDLGGVRAFAPASHVDLRHGADLSYLVGRRLDFTVAQYAKKGRDVVVSRKKMLEEESRRARAEALSHVEPGSVHKGVVRTVVQWGAFVALPDAGGVEGLVHLTEASHDRGAKLADIFKPGEEIEVKVLRVDEKGKLWLSRKAVTADPWDAVKQKYAVGSRHKGKVARLQPFGAFIELESGIDGLIHTSDLSLKLIEHPSEIVKPGDEIDVVVASLDPGAHKIGLHPAPPAGEENEPKQRVQQYKPVKVAVHQIVEGGLVVRILGVTGRAARAFIPAGQTGTPRGTDLRKEFPVGTKLEAKVLEVDPRRGEAKLSIRALKDDAEKQAYQQYRAGVARDAKFGTFADLLKNKGR